VRERAAVPNEPAAHPALQWILSVSSESFNHPG